MEEEDIEFRTIIAEERVKRLCEDDAQSPSSRKAAKRPRSARNQLQSAPKDLCAILEKAVKEDSMLEQPLYISVSEGVIKCCWCGELFKGSSELKHINQHVKKAASHISAKVKLTGSEGEDLPDIRTFFCIQRS